MKRLNAALDHTRSPHPRRATTPRLSGHVSSACGLRFWIVFGNAGQNNRLTVREFSHKRQTPAHGLDGLPERGQQKIAALLKPRHAVLGDAELFGDPDLRELPCVPQFAQGAWGLRPWPQSPGPESTGWLAPSSPGLTPWASIKAPLRGWRSGKLDAVAYGPAQNFLDHSLGQRSMTTFFSV